MEARGYHVSYLLYPSFRVLLRLHFSIHLSLATLLSVRLSLVCYKFLLHLKICI